MPRIPSIAFGVVIKSDTYIQQLAFTRMYINSRFKSKAIEVDHLELLTLRTNNWYWNRFWRVGPASAHRSGKNISSIGEMMECNRCPALQCRFAYPS